MSGEGWVAAYAVSDAELTAAANAGLVRRAAKLLAGSTPEWVSREAKAGVLAVGGFQVRLDAGGVAKARCPCPSAGVCTHVLAAAMLVRSETAFDPAAETPPAEPVATPEQPAESAESTPSQPTLAKKQRTILEETREQLADAVSAGLAHLRPEAESVFRGLAVDTRAAGLHLLGRMLNAVAELSGDTAARSDAVSEQELTTVMARAWALTRAIEAAEGDALAKLIGVGRRAYSENQALESLTLLPLGAAWWVSDAGARGITLSAWDSDASELRSVTSARPHGTDPGFARVATNTAFFGTALSGLLEGPFRVARPRMSEDGVLSATAGGVQFIRDGFSESQLDAVCKRLPLQAFPQVGFGAVDRPVALLKVDGFGELGLDEAAQQLVWKLPGHDIPLRQQVRPETDHRADTLLKLDAHGRKPSYVFAQRNVVRSVGVWEPVALFLREKGKLTLFALDFHYLHTDGLNSALQRRFQLWLKRFRESTGPAASPPRPQVARAADEAQELIVSLTATGRDYLTPTAQAAGRRLAGHLDDLGLLTLAAAIRRLETDCSPDSLFRAHYLATQVAVLAG
jgi:hypothetical protein